ncbi:serine hydrolase [bacterium]|nr:serine hydrolase [bacterium]
MAQNYRNQYQYQYSREYSQNRAKRAGYKTNYSRSVQCYTQTPLKKGSQPQRHTQIPSRIKRKKVSKKAFSFKVFFANTILLSLLSLVGYFILPTGFNDITKPLFLGENNKEITFNAREILYPTLNYMSNDWYFGQRYLSGANVKNPKMSTFFTAKRMTGLEDNLTNLIKQYPSIKPAIYVWDYDTGNYVDINGSKLYASASIIKIPVLIQLFKKIESGQIDLFDKMELTDYYKASGSGNMQYYKTGSMYTLDELARVMIQTSDNSATNMLIAKVGSMIGVNRAIRDWGLTDTHIENWLPDLEGTNYTTAKDLTTMLYNLDNPSFLSISSREYIIDYMSKVKNNRLIQAGLGKDALFVHKTGDIGKMLGDAGIVYMPNNKKYAVVILAERPYNSPLGVQFIQKASKTIYDYMLTVK